MILRGAVDLRISAADQEAEMTVAKMLPFMSGPEKQCALMRAWLGQADFRGCVDDIASASIIDSPFSWRALQIIAACGSSGGSRAVAAFPICRKGAVFLRIPRPAIGSHPSC